MERPAPHDLLKLPLTPVGSYGMACALLLVFAVGSAGASGCEEFEVLGMALAGSRDSGPAQAVERGEEALARVMTSMPECNNGRGMLLGGIASNLHILGRLDEAVQRYEQALAVLDEDASPAQIAFVNRGLGVVLVEQEDYERALQHYLTALGVSDAAGDAVESAKTAGNLGILYSSIGELQKARDYHRRSLESFELAGFKPGIAGALINLGAVAAKFGEAAEAAGDAPAARAEHRALQDSNQRALGLFEELGNPRGVAYAASNVGLAHDRLDEPGLALPQHQRSLALRREIGDAFGTINSLLSLGTTLASLRRHDEAAAAVDEAAALIPSESLNLQREVAEHRVRLAEARKDYEAAFAAQREVTRVAGRIAGQDQLSQVTALQDRFDAEQSARQIERLRSEAKIAELQLQRQRNFVQLSILITLLAVGLFLLLLNRYRAGVVSARKLSVAARTDQLTGLSNRGHIAELLQEQAARVEAGGRGFCVLMADLDDFKAINDHHGHDAGDAVLREVARRLRDAVRLQDTVARWGGEEFLLLLPGCSETDGLRLANKLRDCVSHPPIRVGASGAELEVTATLGVCEYVAGASVDGCIKQADSALYEGKRAGKDRSGLASQAAPLQQGIFPSDKPCGA